MAITLLVCEVKAASTEPWLVADVDFQGSFRAPPPGQPVDKPYNDKELKLGEKVTDINDPVARHNFRVVVIKPEQVEQLDLHDPTTARRQVYTFDGSSGEWQHQECWP